MNNAISRKTGLELLRIIAMLLIVFSHFACHGGIDYTKFSINNAFLTIIEFGGKIGVNIFILISGYFSCTSKFSVKRIMKLIVATEFYSILLMIISIMLNAQIFSKTLLLKSVFPLVIGDGYWFVSAYIILYVFSPILNSAVEKLSQRYLALIILFLISVYSIIPNFVGIVKRVNDYGVSTIIWFITLYLLGAYLRKYSFKLFNNFKLSVILLISLILIMFTARVGVLYFGKSLNTIVYKFIYVFANSNLYSVMPLLIAVLFFIVFYNINIASNSLLHNVAKATFGVYLIHDNVLFRDYMWTNIIHTEIGYQCIWYPFYVILMVLILFAVCTIIDMLYCKFIERNIFRLPIIDKVIIKIDKLIT